MRHIYDVITSCDTFDQLDVCSDWIIGMKIEFHWKLFFKSLIGDVRVHISEVNNGGKVIELRTRPRPKKGAD